MKKIELTNKFFRLSLSLTALIILWMGGSQAIAANYLEKLVILEK